VVGIDNLANTINDSGYGCQVDIGVGAAGSEQAIVFDLPVELPYAPPIPCIFGPFYIPIPAGTRISARLACGLASNTLGVSVYGIF
jgi:hypothetical protein